MICSKFHFYLLKDCNAARSPDLSYLLTFLLAEIYIFSISRHEIRSRVNINENIVTFVCTYAVTHAHHVYSKTCVKRPLKNGQNNDLNDKSW